MFLAVAAAISFLHHLPLAGSALLALWFLAGVILPALLGTAAFAVSSVVMRDVSDGARRSVREAALALRPVWREIVSAGLLAGMLSLALVIFLRGAGLLLLPLAYGPPILIQVIALEATPLQLAWSRTRDLLRGNWGRVLIALLAVVLAISLLGATALATVFAATEGADEVTRAAAMALLRAVVVGVTLPFLAGVHVALYSRLREGSESR